MTLIAHRNESVHEKRNFRAVVGLAAVVVMGVDSSRKPTPV